MEIKYSKEKFEGFTHRFIVRFSFDNDWRNDTNMDIYSNSDSYKELEDYINKNKTNKVKNFTIVNRSSKKQDELDSKFIDDFLNQKD